MTDGGTGRHGDGANEAIGLCALCDSVVSKEMPRKKLTIKPPSQLETLKTTPSELAKQALLKSGAGVHGERRKRSRQKDRQEEIQATLEGDVEE